jgi:predicted amidohydrolase YtcJ
VAIHCVTRVALVLSLTAWQDAGTRPGDRIEHASVVPVEVVPVIGNLGLTVVTQPNFIAERGDDYRHEVDPEDRDDLYRCRTLVDAGIPVGGGTDAPFGDPDPWRAVRAAIERRTRSGHVLGPGERLARRRALDLFLAPLDDPGGPPRTIRPGAPADVVLLAAPLDEVLAAPAADAVVATMAGGRLIFDR